MTLKATLSLLTFLTFTGCVTTKHHIIIDHNIKINIEHDTVNMLKDIMVDTNNTKNITDEKNIENR